MEEAPRGIEEYLEHCFEKFLKPVMTELGLRIDERQLHDLGGLYQVSAGAIAVRLVNDRGLASLDIASRGHNDWYDVECPVCSVTLPISEREPSGLTLKNSRHCSAHAGAICNGCSHGRVFFSRGGALLNLRKHGQNGCFPGCASN